MTDTRIVNTADESRYEVYVDGQLAGFIDYVRGEDSTDLTHTEVFEGFDGQGLAGQLAAFALADVRSRGQRVIATCPYVATYIKRHPEYQDLLGD